jgi:hypothetical protein
MVASTWITPGGLQFFEERKTFSHGLGQLRKRGARHLLVAAHVRERHRLVVHAQFTPNAPPIFETQAMPNPKSIML